MIVYDVLLLLLLLGNSTKLLSIVFGKIMAADQRKRRLSSTTSPFGYGSQEQYRAKKRDFRSLQYEFNFNNHVSLKWDDDEKRVVAKEEQIGISSRHLSAFGSVSNAKLADVISVPNEAFNLSDLSEVLSYEVWQSLLTEKERSFLVQFLPRGVEPDEVVQALLGGKNFHFGNPLLTWGSSLCSGDLHPDAVVQHEKSFKANKKATYSKLQQYHDNMIRNLQKLKERCGSSKDPEAEISKIMSRSKGDAERTSLLDVNGYKSHKVEENAMHESPSSNADEKSYYSDNQKLSAIRDAEIQKRIRSRELMKDKNGKSIASPNGLKGLPRPKKVEKSQKANVSSNDGTKYMSYVKISKKQHELVKSMKQSGTSIQSKNLNRLLGNVDSFNVKPYEMFGEEEQKRVHKHWTNLVNKDLPAALQKWRNGQLERLKITSLLWQEMCQNRLLTKDEKSVKLSDEGTAAALDMDAENSQGISEDPQDDGLATQGSMSDSDNLSGPCSLKNESTDYNSPLNVNEEFDPSSIEDQSLQNPPSDVKEESDLSFIENQPPPNPSFNVNEEFDLSSMENRSLRTPLDVNEEFDPSPIENKSSMDSPLNDNQDFNPMDLNAENSQVISERSDTCSMPEERVVQTSEVFLGVSHSAIHGSAIAANVVEMPSSSVKNMWSSVRMPESYSHGHPTTQFASSSEPIVRHVHAVPEQPTHLINLQSELPEDGTTKDLLNRHTNHMSFFNPYPNRDRNELLQSLIKRDNYHQEPKKTGLEFHPANVMLEPSQFSSHFREQLQPSFPLDHRQRAQSELFMNQNIQDSIYSESNRYSIQGQEHFPSLNIRDWSSPRMSAPLQSQLSSRGLLNHNWFANDSRAHGGWSGSDGAVFPSTSIGAGSSGDQSLYSVLSQCNTLHSRAPFNPMASTEQMIPSTSYGHDMAAGIPMTSNPLIPQTASPFDYLSGGEAAVTLKNPNMSWMSLGHQPSALHDPSGRPSWHQ